MKGPESHGYVLKVDGSGNVIGWEELRSSLLGNFLSADTDSGINAKAVLFAYDFTVDDGTITLLSAQTSAATTQSDNQTLDVNAQLYAHNGTDFARLRSVAGNADNVTPLTAGMLASGSFLFAYDSAGVNWDRVRSLGDSTDAQSTTATGDLATVSHAMRFNGSTWDRARSQSAANAALSEQIGVALATPPANWSITHAPAANTQATITRAAAAAGIRHVCTGITFSGIGLAAAAETSVVVNLRDGASGAGTVLWSQRIYIPVGGQNGVALSGLQIHGSAATAMTLEFAAAGGANTFESVSLTGYDVA